MEVRKVLGQAVPAATTLTDLYTVPAATEAVTSSLVVCNRNNAPVDFRVAVAVGGAADAPEQYLYYDVTLGMRSTFVATIGLALGAGDVVRVEADTADVSFNLFGVEVS